MLKPFSVSCLGCEYLLRIRIGDEFDRGTDWTCCHAHKYVDPYCDEKDAPPPLPEWCPRIPLTLKVWKVAILEDM